MVNVTVSESVIQNRIKLIFDFIYDDSNTALMQQRLNDAWYELFGMQYILAEATNIMLLNTKEQRELDGIFGRVAQALLEIEQLYDKAVNEEKHLGHF